MKKAKIDLESLWAELDKVEKPEERFALIYSDTISKKPIYKRLAEDDPFRLFRFLGGDTSNVDQRTFWAYEYTYQEYLENMELDYDPEEAASWDLEERSIERANDTGNYYVTGLYTFKGENDQSLTFEFDYCEGYLDRIIGTPYYTDECGHEHGFQFS